MNIGVPFTILTPINQQSNNSEDSDEITESVEINTNINSYSEEIISDARGEATQIIEDAMLQAEILLNKAQTEIMGNCESVLNEARREGFDKGYNEGKAQFDGLIFEANDIKNKAISHYNEVMSNVESDIISMVLDISRKVISSEIKFNKENIFYLVKNTIEKCANREEILLKTSDEDYEYLCKSSERLRSQIEGLEELKIKNESSLSTGNFIVETPYGCVDASVDTKIKKIEETFSSLIEK